MGRAQVMAAALAALALSGCGVETVQSERYALRLALAEVYMAYDKRAELVDNAAAVLKSANLADPHELQEWDVAKREAAGARPAIATNPDNTQIRAIGERLHRVRRAGDALVDSARTGLAANPSTLEELPRAALRRTADEDSELVRNIETAHLKYAIQVQTYNQVINVFPVNVAAKVMGEEQRVALSDTTAAAVGQGGEDQKGREAATTRSRPKPPH